ncbi:MAG: signal peptidase I [Vulcanimicrobiaceae bacterium]
MLSPLGRWRHAASIAFQVALLGIIAYAFTLRTPQVTGRSMEPRIDSGEIVLIDTLAFAFGSPNTGEIVAFHHDATVPVLYVKRIVGVPGDRIAIVRGTVVRDGHRLDEPYVRFHDDRSFAAVVVPPGAYYVLGDNRADSDDSRVWGFVGRSQIVGRAVAGIWPLDHFGPL